MKRIELVVKEIENGWVLSICDFEKPTHEQFYHTEVEAFIALVGYCADHTEKLTKGMNDVNE